MPEERTGGPEELLERHRSELTAYCYRMLGSPFEAEDAVQETFLRAWRGLAGFEGRASLRTWLYRIATNVCFDLLRGRERRALPADLGPPGTAADALGEPLAEDAWVLPAPDRLLLPEDADPAEVVELRESVRLAFLAALQRLPPRQRAVLILREVLGWRAVEVAGLLGTSVAAVNSALQRARAALAATREPLGGSPPMAEEERDLLERYVDAFERYDLDALTSLLHEDAAWTMPPYRLWLRTHEDIRRWCLGPGIGCLGSRLVPTRANGAPAFGHYKPGERRGVLDPWSLQVLDVAGGRIAGIAFHLDTGSLFPLFDLPPALEASP
ncbi:MAG TPA: sigma-70 family RNA polymerase sigma factor [Actinomycetota bacterium]|nr:sigma-70 family RNA polymerase sigma factor [Actinomycetota bacterium]